MQLIARAPDTGRSSSHLSSPRTARVAKAESSRGGRKRTGLSASHAATTAPCLGLRFQTGSRTSGVDAHRVHTLQGCECREKTHRLKCDPVEVMATVLSRRRPTCCWSKTAVAKEPRARRLGDSPSTVRPSGSGLDVDSLIQRPLPPRSGGQTVSARIPSTCDSAATMPSSIPWRAPAPSPPASRSGSIAITAPPPSALVDGDDHGRHRVPVVRARRRRRRRHPAARGGGAGRRR